MEFQFNTDNAVKGDTELSRRVRERIYERLQPRFGLRLTRIEVHVRDVDGTSNRGDGIEAKIEARPASGQPIVVSARGPEPLQAINSALAPMVNRLESAFGKADRHRQ
jgi:hypothetical protein